jgi:hypothetical protein
MFASTPHYVAAAIVVLQAEDPHLVKRVLVGHVSLLAAAAQVKTRAKLLAAYRAATPKDLAVLRAIDSAAVPDPAVDPDEEAEAEAEEEEQEDVEDLLAEARVSGDIASYLQKRGFATLGDVFRET